MRSCLGGCSGTCPRTCSKLAGSARGTNGQLESQGCDFSALRGMDHHRSRPGYIACRNEWSRWHNGAQLSASFPLHSRFLHLQRPRDVVMQKLLVRIPDGSGTSLADARTTTSLSIILVSQLNAAWRYCCGTGELVIYFQRLFVDEFVDG